MINAAKYRVFGIVIFVCGGIAAAHGMELAEQGNSAILSGKIEEGDGEVFAKFIHQKRPQRLKVLYLDSRGGSVDAGISIARQVRAAGIATAIHATSSRCDSACTLVFAGGVQRYYINGDRVFEGFSSMSGLGFHCAHIVGDATHPAEKSENGTAKMRRVYRELGQPAAAELVNNVPYNALFHPGGQTALTMHIATSLAAPPDY